MPQPQPPPDWPWRPLDRDRLDREITGFLEGARRAFALNPHLSPLYARISAFVVDGGKRTRPRLCLASFRIMQAAGESAPTPPPVWKVAASLELFHAFMLVHDDLIDGSLTRRDQPALHGAIRNDLRGPSAAKRSADLGLIGGDLLFALGMRLLGESGLDGETFLRAHRLLSDMLLDTGLGEALDVLYDDRSLDRLDEAHILEAYRRKTARYTISGPLVLGATLAGASEAACRALDEFGTRLGLAYQIGNDLEALDGDWAHGEISDLDGGKRTIVLWKAHRLLNLAGRRALEGALGLPPGPEKRRRLLDLIEGSGAPDECRDLLTKTRSEAIALLRRSALSAEHRLGFLALAELVRPAPVPVERAVVANATTWTRPLPAAWADAT